MLDEKLVDAIKDYGDSREKEGYVKALKTISHMAYEHNDMPSFWRSLVLHIEEYEEDRAIIQQQVRADSRIARGST